MKNVLKYSAMMLLAVLALTLGACTEEYEYTKAKATGEQVYFRNDISVASMAKDRDTVQVPVNRIQSKGELQVQLQVTQQSDSKLSIPSSVTFADGETQTYLVISYDPEAIDYGFSEDVTLAITDQQLTTQYGNSSCTFKVELSPWRTIGQGLYKDGLMATFGLDDVISHVEIQEDFRTPGLYRIVSPYAEGTEFYNTYLSGAYVFRWIGGDNINVIIDATDPDYVYLKQDFYAGFNVPLEDMGDLHALSYVQLYLNQGVSLDMIKAMFPELFGKLVDGVITLPQDGLALNFDGTMEPSNYGVFSDITVALPGYQFVDYSSSFEYTGRFTDTEGNDYAQGEITLGRDVESAKYVVASEGDDVNAIVSAIEDGSLPGTTITESGSVSFTLEESGDYTMVIVTYGADGKMHGSSATPFTFTLSGDASAKPEWVALYNGTFTHNVMPNWIVDENDNFVGNPLVGAPGFEESYASVIYQDINNPSNYKVSPYLASEDGLEFTMDADGIISFNDVATGWQNQQYGNLFVADAYIVFESLGQQLGSPSSYFDSQNNEFAFGTIYYYNMATTHYGLAGGAYETFTITSTASVAPHKGMKSRLKALLPKAAKAGARHFKKPSGITAVQAAAVKGDLKRSVEK